MTISATGLISGLDVNNMIDELMEVERLPIRRKEAQIERTEQISELWREVNTVLGTFQQTISPLQAEETFTAPMPESSNEDVLTASVSGNPSQGTHHFNVEQLANFHSVATQPVGAGDLIANPNDSLGHEGTFYLGIGNSPESIDSLSFDESTKEWLHGNLGTGLQAVLDGEEDSHYFLNPAELAFATDQEGNELHPDAESIKVYMDSFTDQNGEDISGELQDYFDEKGWDVDLDELLFEIKKDGAEWVAVDQNGNDFALAGDHPLGGFGLRGEVVDGEGEVLAVDRFDLDIRNELDQTGQISIEEDDSLGDIVDRINAASAETGVEASLVMSGEDDYRLVLQSTEEGSAGFIQAHDLGDHTVLKDLSLLGEDSSRAGPDYLHETQEAQDAKFTLNGLEMIRSSNTFTDAVSGVEISLSGEGPSTVEVAPAVDEAMEDIKLFVESYNEANAFIRRLQTEDDGPLQGSGDLMRMERQVRTLIHGEVSDVPGSNHLRDSLVYSGSGETSATGTGTYEGLRNEIKLEYNKNNNVWRHDGRNFTSGDEIEGVAIEIDEDKDNPPQGGDTLILEVSPASEPLEYNSLSAIGIMAEDERGRLEIDESKLKEALSGDPESVFGLFGREAPVDSVGRSRGPDGLAQQFKSRLNEFIGPNGLVQSRENSLQREMTQFAERIEMLERRVEMRENRLIRQFTYMEQYIAKLQDQTGLMSSFEAGQQQE